MAILELVVTGKYYDQLSINRYHYVASGTPAAVSLSFALCYATGYLASRLTAGIFSSGTVAKYNQANVSNSVSWQAAYARNLYSVTDFYEAPFPSPPVGELTGDSMSPTQALGFYSSRVRTDVRRGYKRFVGVTEAFATGGGVISGTPLAALAAWADVLSETLTYDDEGNTITFTPAVLGLDKYTTPAGNPAYRPYPTESSQLSHTAQGIAYAPYTTVRTQNSRQYSRGA